MCRSLKYVYGTDEFKEFGEANAELISYLCTNAGVNDSMEPFEAFKVASSIQILVMRIKTFLCFVPFRKIKASKLPFFQLEGYSISRAFIFGGLHLFNISTSPSVHLFFEGSLWFWEYGICYFLRVFSMYSRVIILSCCPIGQTTLCSSRWRPITTVFSKWLEDFILCKDSQQVLPYTVQILF